MKKSFYLLTFISLFFVSCLSSNKTTSTEMAEQAAPGAVTMTNDLNFPQILKAGVNGGSLGAATGLGSSYTWPSGVTDLHIYRCLNNYGDCTRIVFFSAKGIGDTQVNVSGGLDGSTIRVKCTGSSISKIYYTGNNVDVSACQVNP